MPEAPFADAALAARLERVAAEDLATFADAARALDPASPAEVLRVAGGVALFAGPRSPINQAAGLGFDGEVALARRRRARGVLPRPRCRGRSCSRRRSRAPRCSARWRRAATR